MLPEPEEDIARQLERLQKSVESLQRQRSGANRLIDGVVRTVAAASITFSNIPSIYADLLILFYLRGTRSSTDAQLRMRFNADAGNNYDYIFSNISTGGASAAAAVAASFMSPALIAAASAPANTYETGVIRINNYANTTNHKSLISQFSLKLANAANSLIVGHSNGWWRDISAITSITLLPNSDGLLGRIDLYGIQGVE